MEVNKISQWTTPLKNSVTNVVDATKYNDYHSNYLAETNLIYFFDSGQKNPSVAKIIANDVVQKNGLATRMRFYNKYNSKQISGLRKEFENAFETLYPKTSDLRNKLIKAGRFVLDEVKPKASKLEKFLLGFKL